MYVLIITQECDVESVEYVQNNQFSRVSLRIFVLLLLQRAAAHEQRSVSLSLIVSYTMLFMKNFDFRQALMACNENFNKKWGDNRFVLYQK